MPLELKIVTIKPATDEVEYGVKETVSGTWIVHGVVINQPLGPDTTGAQLVEAATVDAIAKGYLPAPEA